MNKIPEITSPFWVIKTVITAACVFWPDYLFDHLGKPATAAVIVFMTGAALTAQFHATRYGAWEFWSATLLVGVAGTEAANGLHLALGTAYVFVAMIWLIILVGLLIAWKIRIGATGLRRVDSAPPERFYWGCALAASAAGTAITHLTPSWLIALPTIQVVLWAGAVGACAIASRYVLQLSAPLFWCGFVLTRPLGTGCAFTVGGSHHTGALGLGPLLTTVLFVFVSVAMLGVAAAGQAAQGNTTESNTPGYR